MGDGTGEQSQASGVGSAALGASRSVLLRLAGLAFEALHDEPADGREFVHFNLEATLNEVDRRSA